MSNLLLLVLAVVLLFTSLFFGLSYVREGANKQVISSQADSLIKISRIWAD
ncbi:small membrane protein, partial [Klebsiella pneumoniae]|nr:small membrane protein [Klebsiella pneumoniae]MBR8566771.1 small membrane protein [Klebsiella pneumoniae]MBR8577939.1 small membrane protein [Klebsiella pneumoniae]MBR8583267.1 small membrane protein [Klebsiella pneumoniae]